MIVGPISSRSIRSSLGSLAVFVAATIWCAHALAQKAPAGTTPAPPQSIVVAPIPLLEIDAKTNGGSVSLLVHNSTTKEMKVNLQADSFFDVKSQRSLSAQGSLMKASETSGASLLLLVVPAGETVATKLSVTGYRDPGESTMTLKVNGQSHVVQARFLSVPFNVGVQSATADKPKLALAIGKQGLMVLKNEDAMNYRVAWQLYIPESGEMLNSSLILPATSTVPVKIPAPEGWFRNSFQGLFKDDARAAYVTLQFAPELNQAPAGTVPPTLPSKTVAVQLDLASQSDFAKAWLGNGVVIFVLVLGACLSMVMNGWVPNYLRRAKLLRRLDLIAKDIRRISGATDSRLRVILRMERIGLQQQLKEVVVPGLSSSDAMTEFETAEDALQRRVAAVIRLDAASRKRDEARGRDLGAPHSLLEEIDTQLNTAIDLMTRTIPEQGDFDQAKAAIAKAEQSLGELSSKNPTFVAKLLASLAKHVPEFATNGDLGKLARCGRLSKSLPGLFAAMVANYGTAEDLDTSRYHELDLVVQKLNVVRDFLLAANAVDNDPRGEKMATELQNQLVNELQRNDWRALRRAWNIVSQLKQGVTTSMIADAIRNGQAKVLCQPNEVVKNEPVRLSIALTDPHYDTSRARENLVCTWTFPSPVSSETGWEITHFFRDQSEAEVSVFFTDPQGEIVRRDASNPKSEPVVLTLEAPQSKSAAIEVRVRKADLHYDTRKAEWLRLILAVGLAIMGLIAGARDQFMKLDVFFGLLAVLLLGFTTDTIKNLFAKKP